MSIFHDDRQFSDDESEYMAWKSELERECRKDDYEPERDEGEEDE
jgi:hypothetical protein